MKRISLIIVAINKETHIAATPYFFDATDGSLLKYVTEDVLVVFSKINRVDSSNQFVLGYEETSNAPFFTKIAHRRYVGISLSKSVTLELILLIIV